MPIIDRELVTAALLNIGLGCAVALFAIRANQPEARPVPELPSREPSPKGASTTSALEPSTFPRLRIFHPLGLPAETSRPASPTIERRERSYRLVGVIEGQTARPGQDAGVALIESTLPDQLHRVGLRDQIDQWRLIEIRRTSVVLLSTRGRSLTLHLNDAHRTRPALSEGEVGR